MTLDQAIKHCEEVAEQNETKALRISWQYKGTLLDREAKECRRCAAEHRQLAEWLRELQELRSLKSDYVIFRAEAKKLLEAAIDGFEYIKPYLSRCDGHCNNCPFEKEGCCCIDWKYAEEAEKLFGGMKWISI